MAEIFLTFYHGTVHDVAEGDSDLFGISGRGEFSGSLTNVKSQAEKFALVKAPYPERARVVSVRLPQSIVIDHGPIPGVSRDAHGYSTTDLVEFEALPSEYRISLSYLARELARSGKIKFHRIERRFVLEVLEIEK